MSARGMALKSTFGEQDFDLWAQWNEQDESWNERDGRNAWKSIKANGRVTVGSLFYEAQRRSFKFNGVYQPIIPSPMPL